MAKYASIIEHDRVIASDRFIPIGARPSTDPNLANPETTPADAPTIPSEEEISGWTIEDVSVFSTVGNLSVESGESKPSAMQFNSDGTKLYVLGRTTVEIYEYDLSTAYDVTSGEFVDSYAVETYASTFFIDDTGTYLFIGRSKDGYGSVYKYELGSAWDLSDQTLTDCWSVRGGFDGITGLWISENGFHMVISGDHEVKHFYLDYPWYLETARETSNFTPTQITAHISSIMLNPEGSQLFIMQATPSKVFQYSLGTDYEVGSATYDTLVLAVDNDTVIYGLQVYDEETIYSLGWNTDAIYQYALFLPWEYDVMKFYFNQEVSIEAQVPDSVSSTFMSPDGTNLYVTGLGVDDLFWYTLSDPFNVNTITYQGNMGTSTFGNSYCWGLFFKPDGTKAWSIYSDNPEIIKARQYTLSTPWDITSGVSRSDINIASVGFAACDGIQIKADGTRCWFSQRAAPYDMAQVDLSTPWDLNSAGAVSIVDLSAEGVTSNYTGFYISEDGTSMVVNRLNTDPYVMRLDVPFDITGGLTYVYTVTNKPDRISYIHEEAAKMYYLSQTGFTSYVEEWDLQNTLNLADSTLRTTKTLSEFSGSFEPTGTYVSPDGVYMYLPKNLNGGLYQYEMTTPWDLDTLTLVTSVPQATWDNTRSWGLDAKPDGTKFYGIDVDGGDILLKQFNLSTPWDISTMTLEKEKTLDPGASISDLAKIQFKADGTRMWVSQTFSLNLDPSLYQIDLSTPWDIASATLDGEITGTPTEEWHDFYVSDDGTVLYGTLTDNYMFRYELDTPYDILGSKTLTNNSLLPTGGWFVNTYSNRVYETPGKVYRFQFPGFVIGEWDVYGV